MYAAPAILAASGDVERREVVDRQHKLSVMMVWLLYAEGFRTVLGHCLLQVLSSTTV